MHDYIFFYIKKGILLFKCLGLVRFFLMKSIITKAALLKNIVKMLYCEILLQFKTTIFFIWYF